jgi:hypothetical protein
MHRDEAKGQVAGEQGEAAVGIVAEHAGRAMGAVDKGKSAHAGTADHVVVGQHQLVAGDNDAGAGVRGEPGSQLAVCPERRKVSNVSNLRRADSVSDRDADAD